MIHPSSLQVIKQLLLEQEDMDPFAIELQLKEMSLSDHAYQRKTLLSNQTQTLSKPKISPQKEEKPAECPICLDDLFSEKATICLQNCPDIIHVECLENYLVLKISERSFPLKCPLNDCKKELHIEDIKDSLQTKTQYQVLIEQYSLKSYLELNPKDFDYCKTPDCDFAYLKNPNEKRFMCLKCKKDYCKECEAAWQSGHNCYEQREPLRNMDRNFTQMLRPINSNRDTQRSYESRPRPLNFQHPNISRCNSGQIPVDSFSRPPNLYRGYLGDSNFLQTSRNSINQNYHPPFSSRENNTRYGQRRYQNPSNNQEFKRIDPRVQARENDRLFENLSSQSGFRNCPSCTIKVERTEGCDHMSCRCGTEFCYRCGGFYGRCNC